MGEKPLKKNTKTSNPASSTTKIRMVPDSGAGLEEKIHPYRPKRRILKDEEAGNEKQN